MQKICNKIIKNFHIIVAILLLINPTKALAEVNFNMNYYSDKYIYKNEYKLNLSQKFFNNGLEIGGYIKQNTINIDKLEEYIEKNNYSFNLKRKFVIEDDKNYFYKLYTSLRIFHFKYPSFNQINNSIFLNISYYDNIKYFELLKLTFVNEIYKRYGIGLNYLVNNNDFKSNLYFNYIITKEKIKDTLNMGFNVQRNLNESFYLKFNYDYLKDLNKKDNKQHTLRYENRIITYYYDILMNESHDFSLNSILRLDKYFYVNLGLFYRINKNFDNNLGFNFSIGF